MKPSLRVDIYNEDWEKTQGRISMFYLHCNLESDTTKMRGD